MDHCHRTMRGTTKAKRNACRRESELLSDLSCKEILPLRPIPDDRNNNHEEPELGDKQGYFFSRHFLTHFGFGAQSRKQFITNHDWEVSGTELS